MDNFGTILIKGKYNLKVLPELIQRNIDIIALLDEYCRSYGESIGESIFEKPGFIPTRIDVEEFARVLTKNIAEQAKLIKEIAEHPDEARLYLKDILRDREEKVVGEPVTNRVSFFRFPNMYYRDIVREGVKYIGKVVKIDGIITIGSETPVIDKTYIEYEHLKCGGRFIVILGDIPPKITKCPICRQPVKPGELNEINYEEDQIFWYGVKDIRFDNRPTPYTVLVMVKARQIPYETLKELRLGSRVVVEGILRRAQSKKFGKKETTFFIEALNIKVKDIIKESKVPKEKLKKVTIEKLIKSLAPEIQGKQYNIIKKALLVSLVSGEIQGRGRIYITNGKIKRKLKIREQVHTLLAGVPGTGKTRLLLSLLDISPRGRYINAIQATGVGLTVAVTKDPTGSVSLAGGALVAAEGGIACIDELDKLGKEQTAYLNEAMENNTITVAKAGIIATLPSHVSVIAAMNIPEKKYTILDAIKSRIREEVLDRFDLIYSIMLNDVVAYSIKEKLLSKKVMKAYITLAKSKDVTIDKETIDYIVEKVNELSKKVSPTDIYESPNRLRDKITRIAAAIAKLKLKDKVEKEDVDEAVELKLVSYASIGILSEYNDKIKELIIEPQEVMNIRKSHLPKYIYNLIRELEKDFLNGVPLPEIQNTAQKRYNLDKDEVRHIVDILVEKGKLYEVNAFMYKTI